MKLTQKQAANEVLRRRAAMESLDNYANYMASSAHLDFLYAPAKHHRVMTHALDRLLLPLDHPQHPKDKNGIPVTKLLLTAPPGSAKSTYVSVQLSTYYLARNPTHHILCSSNVGSLAEAFNRRRRSACMSQEWQNLSQTALDPEARGIEQFFTLKGGSIKAAGVNATIVGIRSNLNILDDPIESWEQAQSTNQLLKIWDWYEGEYRNRLVPEGLEVMMHQRWSRNDPAGILLRMIKSGEEKGWMVINLPLEISHESQLPDPVGRQVGDILWDEWYNPDKIAEWKRDPAKWAALYQQAPLDEEGGWVNEEDLRYISVQEWEAMRRNNVYRYLAAGDLALTLNKGDWTVFIMAAITASRDLIICDVTRHRKEVGESVKALYEMHSIYQPVGWLLDNDNATKVFTRLVYEYARSEKRTPAPLDLLPTRGRDKEIRAAPIRGYFKAHRVYIVNDPNWAPDLIREILSFPGEPDDQVDTLGLLGRKMVEMSGIDVPEEKKPEPVQGLLCEDGGTIKLSIDLDTLFGDNERGRSTWNKQRIN